MPFDFLLRPLERLGSLPASLRVGGREVPLELVRHPRARRYLLRVRPDGSVRVTVPRGGSREYALAFAQRHTEWIARQWAKRISTTPRDWTDGTGILFRGEWHPLRASEATGDACFADQRVRLAGERPVREVVETRLRKLAGSELSARTVELAALHSIAIRRVSVRNQRTRWGSCSVRGTISLNWRLIQTPPSVRDYIILHELMHTREMNHSHRFWAQVEAVCPAWREAERWIRQNGRLLRG